MSIGRPADAQDPRRSGRAGRPGPSRSETRSDRPRSSGRPPAQSRPAPAPTRGRSTREQVPPADRRREDGGRAGDRDLTGVRTATGRWAASNGRQPPSSPSASTRVSIAPPRPGAPARPARPSRAPRQRPASERGRRTRRDRSARVNIRRRTKGALIIVLVVLAVTLGKLVTIQTVDAGALTTAGLDQTQRTLVLPAERGSVDDRNGTPMAFSVAGMAIAAHPKYFENDAQRDAVADILAAGLGPSVSKSALMTKLKSDKSYVYLAQGLMPAPTDLIMKQIAKAKILQDKTLKDTPKNTVIQKNLANAVVTENQDIRTTPDGSLAASVIGSTQWNGLRQRSVGMSGIESKYDALLTGTAGSRTLQVDNNGYAIPDSVSRLTPAVDGTSIRLTLDQDLQYSVQQYLNAQVTASKARGGCAVVKGIGDGQIYAMACDEPGKTAAQIGNPAVSTPFEPGSVNKVVTFAAALDRGLITPTTVMNVNGQISMGGREIHDAWVHSAIDMTATGILGKSSNVGTLMIAQKLGQTAFAQELTKYGLGRKTGIELPGESAGSYPVQSQWSATSFANLPIGQGVSMTLLQLVDMYQAIGNQGVLVSPTIIAGTTKDGVYKPSEIRSTSRVMKPTTAATLLGMLRGTVQSGDYYHRGTGPTAAIQGYQVAGKTGTAQQVDPVTKAYSSTLTNATFAGVVPADNPRYAIAIMIDAPVNGSEGGDSAAPLFHKIASYALRAGDVPPSPTAAPIYDLYVPRAE